MVESITLAIDLAALERMTDPESVIEDARQFATHVGIISAEMGYQASTRLQQLGIQEVDFLTRMDREGGLKQVRSSTETDRYVFVGTDLIESELIIDSKWEYLDVTVASEEAGWDIQ